MKLQQYKEKFAVLQKEYIRSKQADGILAWDWRAITPRKASYERATLVGMVSARTNELLCSTEMTVTLDKLYEHIEELDKVTAACVRLMKRENERKRKIPGHFFSEFAVLQGESESAWEQAKRTDDWELYKPHLKNMFEYTRRMIDLWGYEGSPYNALLGNCEEGMTTDILDRLFTEVRDGIVPLIKKVQHSKITVDDSFCRYAYPVEGQRKMAQMILQYIGFDLERGLIAESEHPYTCSFGLNDVRLTTHYYPNNLLSALFSTLHEGGHGIYEQSYATGLEGTVAGAGLYSGMHESVARFWENIVGRSSAFWQFFLEPLQTIFPEQLKGVTPGEMYRAVNKSGLSYTRIGADELTYNLHIMLRYELERDVFEGKVDIDKLPQLWNEKMESYLGLTPPNGTLGILQDIQWSMAQFGYFPAYALGNIYNAQYTDILKKELCFDKLVAAGDFKTILNWKSDRLYQYGMLRSPEQTLIEITGKPASGSFLVDHLTKKFSTLYRL